MKKSKKKQPKICIFAKRLFLFSVLLLIGCNVFLNSYEIRLNAQTKTAQNEISALKSDIDGLKMKKQEQVSFANIKKVVSKKGYTYQQSQVATTVVGVKKNAEN